MNITLDFVFNESENFCKQEKTFGLGIESSGSCFLNSVDVEVFEVLPFFGECLEFFFGHALSSMRSVDSVRLSISGLG
jgi:hypothetical protein